LGRVSTFIVSVVGLGMLIGPVWALAYLEPIAYWLAVISIFMTLFLIVVALSSSRLIESLAATAAYSAVLVVFLQAGVG
jgi:cell division protein FtsX